MSKIVDMHEAKTNLSKLIEEAERGEDILLARAGKEVARIVPIHARHERQLGQWGGKVRMAEDFDAPLSDAELKAWEGG